MTSQKLSVISLTMIFTMTCAGIAFGISGEGYFGPDNPPPDGIIPDLPSVTVLNYTPPQTDPTPTPSAQLPEPSPKTATTDELKLSPKHEKYSEDPSKVIKSYGLSETKTSGLLDLHQAASRGIGKQEQLNRYSAIIEVCPIDYFAAYRAAMVAYGMVDYEEAMYWVTKALDICPDYMPARRFKKRIEGSLTSD